MQFSNEIQWGKGDYLVAGIIIYTAVVTFGCIFRQIKSKSIKWALAVALLGVVALVWAELAVGLF